MTADADSATRHQFLAAVIGLGLTSIVGWGTSFSAIAILGSFIGKDLGLSREIIFGGITVMLIVSGIVGPRCGRMIDREGPRRVMAFGSVLAAIALAIMSRAGGATTYWLSWAVFGVAVPLALSNASVTAIAQISGPHARRGLTGLTIMAGITSAIFLPVTAWLQARYGWRTTLALYAMAHILICLPIHLTVLPRGTVKPSTSAATKTSDEASWEGVLPLTARKRAYWLIVLWSCCEGMLVWGFNMQAVDLLQGLGLTAQGAVGVWMLAGPSQAAARIIEFALGGRFPIIGTAIASAAMAPIGFAVLFASGLNIAAASVMAVCYGLGHGLFTIARNILPLRLFGLKTFGETMGRLSLPQNLVNALAPLVFAFILSRYGSTTALYFAVGCAVASVASVLVLARSLKS